MEHFGLLTVPQEEKIGAVEHFGLLTVPHEEKIGAVELFRSFTVPHLMKISNKGSFFKLRSHEQLSLERKPICISVSEPHSPSNPFVRP